MMIKNSNKIVSISYLRVISLILIVFYHSLCFYAGLWWYLKTNIVPIWSILAIPVVEIGLTCYFFISGFLYGHQLIKKNKYRDSIAFWNSKIKRLLVPYIIWGFLWAILMPVGGNFSNLFTGIAHLWFLLVLFDLFVLLFILMKSGVVGKETSNWHLYSDIFILFISFLSFYLWKGYTDHHYIIGFEMALFYFPSFILGFYFAKYCLNEYNHVYIAWFGLILSIMTLFILSYYRIPAYNTLYRLPSIIIACCSIMILRTVSLSNKVEQYVSFLDKKSMGIYIFNQFIVFGLLLMPKSNALLCSHPYIGPFVIFCFSFFIPLFLSWLFGRSKYVSWMIGS